MSGLVKKRSREVEAFLNYPKRFHGENQQQTLHLFEDIECVDKIQREEVVRGSLGEEIGVISCSTSYQSSSGLSKDAFLASDMTSAYRTTDAVIDLNYLLGASDDELGLPPSPVVNLEGQAEAISSLKVKDCDSSLDYGGSAEMKGFAENYWQFEDDFLDYSQLAVCEDTVSADWDVVNLGAFIDGDYSVPWGL